MKTEYTFNYC